MSRFEGFRRLGLSLNIVAVFLCAFQFGDSRRASAADLDNTWHWTLLPPPPATAEGEPIVVAPVAGALLAIPTTAGDSPVNILWEPAGKWSTVNTVGNVDWPAVRDACSATATHAVYEDRLICFGGPSSSNTLLELRLQNGVLSDHLLPILPQSIINRRGTVLNDVIYILGEAQAKNYFFKLNLTSQHAESAWETLPSPPVTDLSQAILISIDGSLLLLGRSAETEQMPSVLTAAWRWIPAVGWSTIETLPDHFKLTHALPLGQSHALLMDDSANRALFYHSITNTWRQVATDWSNQAKSIPSGAGLPVTISKWNEGFVFAGSKLVLGEPQHATQSMASVDIAVLSGYFLVLVVMGTWFSRRERTSRDYFRGGQRIPWWAAGLSLLGTSLSAITFMAFPAMAYRTDWVYWIGNFMILAVAPPVIWYYLPFFRRLEITSAYEYLERRFGLTTRLVGSATFLLFQLARMAVVVYLPALGLSAVSGWNVYLCIAAIGLLATFYTTLGGIEAVIWTDVLQVFVLFSGALTSIIIILMKLPVGAETIFSSALAEGKLHSVNLSWSAASTSLWVVIVGNFFKFLIPYSSDQAVIQRYLTTRDERQAAKSIWLNALASIPVWTIFFALGTMLWAFYREFPDRLDPSGRTDEIFAWFIVRELPPGISGLVVAALLAASMSSLDSSLNSMATALTTDFYRRYRESSRIRSVAQAPDSSLHEERSCVVFARFATILLGIVGTLTAAWLAWMEALSIWDLFLAIIGLFGGGLAGMFVAGIFTRRVHENGVLIGFFASAVVLYFARESGSVHFFLYGGIGILTCLCVSWFASLLIADPQKNIEGLTVYSLVPRTTAS